VRGWEHVHTTRVYARTGSYIHMDRTTTKPGRRFGWSVSRVARRSVARAPSNLLHRWISHRPSPIGWHADAEDPSSVRPAPSGGTRHGISSQSAPRGPDLGAKYLVRILVGSAADRKSFKAEEYKYGMSSAGTFARASISTPRMLRLFHVGAHATPCTAHAP
jgi:hypothetical protein